MGSDTNRRSPINYFVGISHGWVVGEETLLHCIITVVDVLDEIDFADLWPALDPKVGEPNLLLSIT